MYVPDEAAMLACAQCALDVYTPRGPGAVKGRISGVTLTEVMHQTANEGVGCQWAVYQIDGGRAPDYKVLAFRGTDFFHSQDLWKDLSLMVNGPKIKATIAACVQVFHTVNTKDSPIKFITGHSLGGYLTQCVCKELNMSGVAFASPGPVGSSIDKKEADALQKKMASAVRVVLNRNDGIANGGAPLGWSHIVPDDTILWFEWGSMSNPAEAHSMEEYVRHTLGMAKLGYGLPGDRG